MVTKRGVAPPPRASRGVEVAKALSRDAIGATAGGEIAREVTAVSVSTATDAGIAGTEDAGAAAVADRQGPAAGVGVGAVRAPTNSSSRLRTHRSFSVRLATHKVGSTRHGTGASSDGPRRAIWPKQETHGFLRRCSASGESGRGTSSTR
jgi:hypothetical protein